MFGQPKSPRFRAALAGTMSAGLVLGLAACGDSDSDSGTSGSNASAAAIDCAPYTKFGDIKGKTVSIYTSIVTPEDTPHIDSYKPFEQCTGATIKYEGDKAFETQVLVRAKAGNPPDIAYVPQPGLVKQLVATGKAVPAPEEVSANTDKFFGADWKAYATVDGKFYGAPLGANVKSLVWYSPKSFKDAGYAVPTTLDELKALSDKMVADKKKPWCAGISSGDATGWPLTDWMEDFMLRLSGPETYDKWVSHEIPFNGPESTAALDAVGAYLKNDQYVNGGLGDVKSIASTTFQDGGLPILEGTCEMHRQASFYAANFPKETNIAEDGDIFAFYLPGKDAASKPVLGAGEFVIAFADRPEVKAFQTYLSSDTWANEKAKISSGWVSANKGLNQANLKNPIDALAGKILLDPNATFRFDGSDQMPAAVGANAFWKQATSWITGQDTKTTVDNIEKAWPK
ncbi:ABC transporter substrate-binding protein [Paractinoplanes rishiriensis]|uniref:Alpha-glucoside ABC transporter substrate-binding protein n=1 Tax=Paractinoplanes rishiriensis TaxID=1050105 RepID=A0A919MW20_9ACTN|nr:ABC transporter substrate-binding protein [Actinoplanes rishiriensis]GIE97403.1 alpha-glucoside ABC transporter substrate-binding protein [Actinoplanes rishiriensis]